MKAEDEEFMFPKWDISDSPSLPIMPIVLMWLKGFAYLFTT